ncbi:very short patch repair endonuclease [Streptosporangium amethystogenes]|uniref:very short patch repair endonuclease n=1 Tax=Streptosporangium amethystogenes TaxID=2002 RepID=UPI0037964BE3
MWACRKVPGVGSARSLRARLCARSSLLVERVSEDSEHLLRNKIEQLFAFSWFRGDRSRGGPMTKTVESWASSEAVRASMRSNKGRDTKPELALRRAVHARGLRYRVSYRPVKAVRRTADLAFTKAKVAVFMDGCFWHGCPQHHTVATTNAAFWAEKIRRTKERDAETNRLLEEAGWLVVRIWEHEDPAQGAARVTEAVIAGRERLASGIR